MGPNPLAQKENRSQSIEKLGQAGITADPRVYVGFLMNVATYFGLTARVKVGTENGRPVYQRRKVTEKDFQYNNPSKLLDLMEKIRDTQAKRVTIDINSLTNPSEEEIEEIKEKVDQDTVKKIAKVKENQKTPMTKMASLLLILGIHKVYTEENGVELRSIDPSINEDKARELEENLYRFVEALNASKTKHEQILFASPEEDGEYERKFGKFTRG